MKKLRAPKDAKQRQFTITISDEDAAVLLEYRQRLSLDSFTLAQLVGRALGAGIEGMQVAVSDMRDEDERGE